MWLAVQLFLNFFSLYSLANANIIAFATNPKYFIVKVDIINCVNKKANQLYRSEITILMNYEIYHRAHFDNLQYNNIMLSKKLQSKLQANILFSNINNQRIPMYEIDCTLIKHMHRSSNIKLNLSESSKHHI